MGRTGRKRKAGIAAHLAAALVLLATACGGSTPAISELLLAPGDLPGQGVIRSDVQTGQTAQGEPTAIAELTASGFTMLHSLVIFDTRESARTALSGVRLQWEQLAGDNDTTNLISGDLAPLDIADRELVAGVLEEVRAGNPASSVIFVQGRVLVRLTITGETENESLLSYAERARVKAARR